MKKYAQLLNAEYIAIQDKKGKTITSYGKYNNDVEEKVIEGWDDIIDWYTSADSLVSAERDYTDYQTVLPNGNTLFYQIQNKEINEVENQAFSWRAILNSLSLPEDAQLIVISKKDDTILVHPVEKMIGKSYQALGYQSEEEFFVCLS